MHFFAFFPKNTDQRHAKGHQNASNSQRQDIRGEENGIGRMGLEPGQHGDHTPAVAGDIEHIERKIPRKSRRHFPLVKKQSDKGHGQVHGGGTAGGPHRWGDRLGQP